mmetsp:Transcript_30163/g.85171  ORF Transcript_30163/g.85171 Transcript_30163/m.85171 type:complete len:393 (+) Transcript_30163:100-1278(+)
MHEPVFRVDGKDGAARAGRWATADGEVATPNLLLYTRRGGLLTLTTELRDSLRPLAQGCQICTMQFLNQPDPPIVKEGGGAKKFLNMDGFVTLACNRDCTSSEYCLTGRRNNDSVSVSIHSGGTKVTPARYMEVIEALQPSAYITLPDDLPRPVANNRARVSVERSQKWAEECMAMQKSLGLGTSQAFFPIMGGTHLEERIRSSEGASKSAANGFAICGMGCGETDAERVDLLEAITKRLPEGKPRFVSGLGPPHQILEAVEAGVDLFDCWYIETLCNHGLALSFPLQSKGAASARAAALGQDSMKMSLYNVGYRTDKLPLVPGCTCAACRSHTRAYIHHLLSTHEMLGLVLLEVHNTHHLLQARPPTGGNETPAECSRVVIQCLLLLAPLR